MDSEEFKDLEGKYRFLSHARDALLGKSELKNGPFVIVDIETTGLNPVSDEIIEIGAMKAADGELKDIFNKLVRPEGAVSEEITRLTGISSDMLEGCPPIDEVLREFIGFIGNAPLIAHNAEFDISFIKDKLKRSAGGELVNGVICTLQTARALLPNLDNHKLHTIAKYFNIEINGRHRAIGDCEATYHIWQHMTKKLEDRGIKTRPELDRFIRENAPQRTHY